MSTLFAIPDAMRSKANIDLRQLLPHGAKKEVAYSRMFTLVLINQVSNTHTHPFNGPFSWTTRVGRYQKGKTNLDFAEAVAVAVASAEPYASLHLVPDR